MRNMVALDLRFVTLRMTPAGDDATLMAIKAGRNEPAIASRLKKRALPARPKIAPPEFALHLERRRFLIEKAGEAEQGLPGETPARGH